MLRWAFRAILCGILVGGLWVAIAFAMKSARESDSFIVQEIEVRGASHVDIAKMERLFKPFIGVNIFRLEVPRTEIADDPWIIRLEMRRVLPDRLVVQVLEEQEFFKYVRADNCYAWTVSEKELPAKCDNISITVTDANNYEMAIFSEIYAENSFIKDSKVELKKGFFHINVDNATITGNYEPKTFARNYKAYVDVIRGRYNRVEHVDMTVDGKVYVRGS